MDREQANMEQHQSHITVHHIVSWETDGFADIHCPETARGCAYARQMIEDRRRRPKISSVHYFDFVASFAKKDWDAIKCKPREEDGIWCDIKKAWEDGELQTRAAMSAITEALKQAHFDKYGLESTLGEVEMKTMFKNAKLSWKRQEKLNAERKLSIINQHITAQNTYLEFSEGPSGDLIWNCIFEAKQAPKCIGNMDEVNLESIYSAIDTHAQTHNYNNWVEKPTSSLPSISWEPVILETGSDSRISTVFSEILFFAGGEDIAYWISGHGFVTQSVHTASPHVWSALMILLLVLGPILAFYRMAVLGVGRTEQNGGLEVLEESEDGSSEYWSSEDA